MQSNVSYEKTLLRTQRGQLQTSETLDLKKTSMGRVQKSVSIEKAQQNMMWTAANSRGTGFAEDNDG